MAKRTPAIVKMSASPDSTGYHSDVHAGGMLVQTNETESKVSPMSALPASLVAAATTTRLAVSLSTCKDLSRELEICSFRRSGTIA